MNRITPRLRLGEQLLARGLIDRDQLEIALAEQAHTGQPLGALLVQLGFVADTLIRDVLAERLGIAAVALEHYIADPAALAVLPEALARHWRVFPLHYQPASRCLQLAMTRPTDLPLCDQIMQHSHGQIARLDPHLACEADILQAIDRHYGHPVSLDAILQEIRQGPVAAPLHPGLADSQPVIRLIDAMLTDAVLKSASDIHFEPEARFVRIRYRIDGVLRQVRSLHKDYWPAMLVRLKVISGLNIAEQRAPQDGRVSLTLSGRAVDFRVSSLPTSHGENLVMRLLDRSRGLLPLARLVPASQLAAVQRLLARRVGQGISTLDYRLVEQPFRQRRGQQRQHAAGASGLTKQGHVMRVAPKRGDILPHPFKRGNLIKQSKIMHYPLFFPLQRGMGEKAEMPETVIEGHNNHATFCQRFAVIRWKPTRADGKPTAVQPDHHRQRLRCAGRGPDVEI